MDAGFIYTLVAVVAAEDGEAMQVFQPRSTSSPTACAGPRSISACARSPLSPRSRNRVRFLDYATLALNARQAGGGLRRPAALER
jgi:hypothetical protein